MSQIVDLLLQIETVVRGGQPAWRVQVGSAREFIPPLTDADLVKAAESATPAGQPPALSPRASTWDGLLAHLAPNGSWRPNARDLELVGRLLHGHLIRGKIAEHVTKLEGNASARGVPLRYVVHVFEGEEDSLLRRLPFELLHHESFWFRRAVGVRLPPMSEACDVRLEPGARVLIAAAHADDRDPSADQLAAHVATVAKLVEAAGFTAIPLLECTPAALASALEDGCDVLYVVCHGEEDLDLHGRLALRGGDVTGRELGEWLEAADAAGRRLQAAILCACSSSVPGRRPGTMGMAEHLATTSRRAAAALGFRAPVKVAWALDFTTEVFAQLAKRQSLESAVASARRKQPVGDSQWSLPLMFAHERDPFAAKPAVARRGPAAPWLESLSTKSLSTTRDSDELRSLLPAAPRPYFTGRRDQLEALLAWRNSSATDPRAVLVGGGGVGKSEIARKLAHDVHRHGWPVIWLERPDRDLAGCLVTMLQLHDPRYRPPDGATLDDLRAAMTRALGPQPVGLLVLDDVEDAAAVDALTPGNHWKVLVTTRPRALVPGATEIEVEPLAPDDAIALLAALTRDREPFPPEEAAAAHALVLALACLPLAIEVAAGLIRRGASLDEARLAALSATDDASVFGRVSRVMERSLAGLDPGDEAAWTLIAALGTAGVTEDHVASGLEEPTGRAARRLFRLRQVSLVRFEPESARYTMHPLARQVARARAEASGTWDATLARAARVVLQIMEWCRETAGHDMKEAHRRWTTQRDLIESLDIDQWTTESPHADTIAKALLLADNFRLTRPVAEHLQLLDKIFARAKRRETLADAHFARGILRTRLGEYESAASALDTAIEHYIRVGSDLVGLANAYHQRGQLRQRISDLDGAEADYERSLKYSTNARSDLCLGNVYVVRGALRARRDNQSGAIADFDHAFEHYRIIQNDIGLAIVHVELGDLHARLDDLARAGDHYAHALKLYESLDLRHGIANVLRSRGHLRNRQADFVGAEADFGAAIELLSAEQDPLGLANAYSSRGSVRIDQGNFEGARSDLTRAIELYTPIDYKDGLGYAHAELGRLQLAWDAPEHAEPEYTWAIGFYVAAHDGGSAARQHLARGALRQRRGDLTGAQADFSRASALFEAADDSNGQAKAEESLAELRAAAKPAE
ncbi:MAG TPA: CHAT domain-containing protein [Kofleriaceae bacterium]|nr:CHAT domain-containing protein [Kofleriaceae bacterium]